MTESRTITIPGSGHTYLTFGNGKPLLYLPVDRSAPMPDVISKFAATRRIAVPLPVSAADGDSEARILKHVCASSDGAPCDIIASGRAAESAIRLAVLHPEMIDKLVIDTPQLEGNTTAGLPYQLAPRSVQLLILIGTQAPERCAQSASALRRQFERPHLAYVYEATTTVADSQPGRYENVVFDFLERGGAFVLKPEKSKDRP
jgi:hypothetical protein